MAAARRIASLSNKSRQPVSAQVERQDGKTVGYFGPQNRGCTQSGQPSSAYARPKGLGEAART